MKIFKYLNLNKISELLELASIPVLALAATLKSSGQFLSSISKKS